MKSWVLMVWSKLKGHRMALAGGVLVLAAFGLVFAGKVSTGTAMVVLTGAAGIAGLSGKLNRHEAAILVALGMAAKAGVDYRDGNKDALAGDAKLIAGEAASELLPALSIHVSGSDPAAVVQAVSDLTLKPKESA